MKDWKTLDPATLEERTGDRIIAEILGWRYMCEAMMIFRHDSFYEGVPPDYPEKSRALVPVPLFTTRTDAALALFEDDIELTLKWRKDSEHTQYMGIVGWTCFVPGAPNGEYTGNAETLPLAICRAWLIWKQRQVEIA